MNVRHFWLAAGGQFRSDPPQQPITLEVGVGATHGSALIWDLPQFPDEDAVMEVTCQITMHDYRAAHPQREGHFGLMLRADLAGIPSQAYRGSGVIVGPLWEYPDGSLKPDRPPYITGTGWPARIEEWGNGVLPFPQYEYVRRGSDSPELQDGVPYKLYVSSKRYGGELFTRYRLSCYNFDTCQYELLKDTRDVQSNNWAMGEHHRKSEALVVFDAAGGAVKPYHVEFTNLQVLQRPATVLV